MKFYELPPAVESAIRNTEIRPYVRVLFELKDGDVFVNNADILEFVATSYKSTEGGIINCGELTLDNRSGKYDVEKNEELTTGLGVQIWYCFGDNNNTFLRFHLFVDDNGFQNQETGFLNKTTKVRLIDLSKKLDDAKFQKNWTEAETLIHCNVCDKTLPEKSLVHRIAARGGIKTNEINCGKLPFDVPYVLVDGSAWKELCALAKAYNAIVECGKDLTLSFIESPYDIENLYIEESDYFLTEKDITHYRFFNNYEAYANNVRLKYTRYVQTEKQELWTYSDGPVWYDEEMKAYYPFSDDSRKIVTDKDYEAIYTAKNIYGKTRNVVFADQLSTEEDFINDMEVTGNEKPVVIQYDTKTYKDRALIQLGRNNQLIGLKKASIYGRAIISENNYSVFVKDDSEIEKHGQIVRNVTSKYLSDDSFENEPFCQRRAKDLLADYINTKGCYYLTTYIPMIAARVGAFMDIRLSKNGEIKKVRIEELTLRYKKEEAFSSEIWVKRV